MIRNQAYFYALAEIPDQESDESRSIRAGLVVLRLVEDWLRMGAYTITTDVTGLRKVKDTVAAVPEGNSARLLFEQIIETLLNTEKANIGAIGPRLLSYGTLLVYDSRWELALDVFGLVLDWTRLVKEHTELALDAALNLASTYRHQGNAEKAAENYTLLRDMATRSKNEGKRLTAEVGFANLAINRGDHSGAEDQLQKILTVAEDANLPDVCALALQNLSYVVAKREDKVTAIRYAYRALQLSKDVRNHDRLLNNIASWFLFIDAWPVSQKAALLVAATAQEKVARASASITLLRIAALTDHVQDFTRYRIELEGMDLPPLYKTEFYLHLGQGYARFGRINDAKVALHVSIDVATAHQYNHFLFLAEEALENIERGYHPPQRTSTPVPDDIQDVVTAITDMCDLVNAGL